MSCDCIEKTNKLLQPFNTELALRTCLNIKTGKEAQVLTVPTAKINPRNRKPMYVLFAKFCPFCGAKRSYP